MKCLRSSIYLYILILAYITPLYCAKRSKKLTEQLENAEDSITNKESHKIMESYFEKRNKTEIVKECETCKPGFHIGLIDGIYFEYKAWA